MERREPIRAVSRLQHVQRRGFSLTELLVVIAIILVLTGFLFPVFLRAKARSKMTSCQSQLRQVAFAMQMYRADHDGQAWLYYSDETGGYTTAGRFRFPWNDWLPLEPYLKDGRLVWCPVPHPDETYVRDKYTVRMWTLPGLGTSGQVRVKNLFDPEPGRIVAYCPSHTTEEMERALPHESGYSMLWKGTYITAREDGGTKLVPSSSIELWYLWRDGHWHETEEQYSSQAWRFPGEPWPPEGSF